MESMFPWEQIEGSGAACNSSFVKLVVIGYEVKKPGEPKALANSPDTLEGNLPAAQPLKSRGTD